MPDTLKFGRFELSIAERQLRADGRPVPLGARAFDLLVALVARRDRLVPKDELLQVVWPGLVVEENNLQVHVSALRKILGPLVITTVPGRGYRFTAALEATSEAAAPAPVARPASAAVRPAAARARLLVADDNKVNRLLLGRALELQGNHVTSVDNGRAALDRLHQERFDLLLLDLEMPEMDGFAVLERLAGDAALRDLPVIVTSSVEGVAQIARCIELGAEDFLQKPVNPVLLKARVGSCLEKKRLRDQQKELIERYATGAMAADDTQQDGVGVHLAGQRLPATLLCARLREFTAFAEAHPPEETIELLNIWTTLMFDAVGSQHGAVNRMSGDGLMAVFGAPMPPTDPADAPLAAVRAALDMVEMLEIFNAERTAAGKVPLAMVVGIATGEVVAGTTGTPQHAAYTCVGATVNAAAALETLAASGTRAILIDGTTQAAVAGRVATDALTAAELRDRKAPAAVHAVRTS